MQREKPAVFDAVKGLMDGVAEPSEIHSPELREAVFESDS